MTEALDGRCLCGAIAFRVTAQPKGASACHCGQCRRQSGHVWASAAVPASALEIAGAPRWYASSAGARRGFCGTCGSVLFWQAHGEDTISFALGALERPTGLALETHIFVADKGDYYDIGDGLPQRP